ncbi:MAG: PAS domain S-box protein, partial [Chloroflexi bacterium]|nr:PAS domain S-box protein [Chloroflexota bacterium]
MSRMDKGTDERTSTPWAPSGGGEMGSMIRSHDWAATPLGPLDSWPQSIRTAVELMLAMRQPVCLWWGAEPRLLYNDEYLTILGGKHLDALGRTMPEVWPELADTVQHPLDAVRAHGARRLVDREFALGAEGERRSRWFTSTWTPIHDESGEVIGVFNVSTETTDRVLAERTLRESEARLRLEDILRAANERFRLAEEAANGFVYDWDIQTGRVTRSEGFQRILGYAPGEIAETAEGWVELIHPDDLAAIEGATPASLGPKQNAYAAEYRVRHRNGRYIDVLDRGLVMRDAAGSIVRIVGSTVDITERKRAEEALRESEAKYRTLFESIDEGFVIAEVLYDGDGRPVDALYCEGNPAASRLTGVPTYTRVRWSEAVPSAEQSWLEIYDRVARTGESERLDQYVGPLGRWYDFYVFPTGEPAEFGGRRVAVIFQDMTERKRLEQRQEYLLRLSDALRPLADPDEIKAAASRILGEELGVNRAFYAEVEDDEWLVENGYEDGVEPQAAGRHPMAPFGQWIIDLFRAGQLLV